MLFSVIVQGTSVRLLVGKHLAGSVSASPPARTGSRVGSPNRPSEPLASIGGVKRRAGEAVLNRPGPRLLVWSTREKGDLIMSKRGDPGVRQPAEMATTRAPFDGCSARNAFR